MTAKDQSEKNKELDKLINDSIVSTQEETFPILDGIIDIERFLSAKYKILWILKEPYDDFDADGLPFGGGWDLKEVLKSKNTISEYTGGKPTFKPMIYTSWGILNDFCLWNDMGNVDKDPSMLEALKSIAYINVKKLPGHKSSYYKTIQDAYDQHKDILLKQIEYINPDIIIGGATLGLFLNDLKLSREDVLKHRDMRYFIKDGKLFIDAYHPAQRPSTTGVSQEMYCDKIITAVENWVINYH